MGAVTTTATTTVSVATHQDSPTTAVLVGGGIGITLCAIASVLFLLGTSRNV